MKLSVESILRQREKTLNFNLVLVVVLVLKAIICAPASVWIHVQVN